MPEEPASAPSRVLWQSSSAEKAVARIAIVGDFLPSGRLALPEGETWQSMARLVTPVFQDADIGIVNLEAVLDAAGLPPRRLNGLGDIVSAPADSLDYLVALRLQIVGAANNHSFDFGSAGVDHTLAAISCRGLSPIGAGRSLRDSPGVFIWNGPENLRVGFWVAAKATRDPATRRFAGVEPATLARAMQALRSLRAAGAQFCVGLLHAGFLRTSHPDPEDVRLLDSLAAAGFDVVAASHSHRISGARLVASSCRTSACFYGLGSLVSGYISSSLEAEGLVVVVSITDQGALAQLEVRPVVLSQDGWAVVPSEAEAHAILERFEELSRRIANGSFSSQFYRDVSESMFDVYWRDARATFRESGVSGLLHRARRIRLRHVKRLVRAVVG
ncbi:MAG TPA: CapA family protein [Candidatus Acidoferrum sp.]|nr:CapA family protein [Candidatus Acidoferrum sp.]